MCHMCMSVSLCGLFYECTPCASHSILLDGAEFTMSAGTVASVMCLGLFRTSQLVSKTCFK